MRLLVDAFGRERRAHALHHAAVHPRLRRFIWNERGNLRFGEPRVAQKELPHLHVAGRDERGRETRKRETVDVRPPLLLAVEREGVGEHAVVVGVQMRQDGLDLDRLLRQRPVRRHAVAAPAPVPLRDFADVTPHGRRRAVLVRGADENLPVARGNLRLRLIGLHARKDKLRSHTLSRKPPEHALRRRKGARCGTACRDKHHSRRERDCPNRPVHRKITVSPGM